MLLLSKILSKFTPKCLELHLTTITLLIGYTPNCKTYSFPRLPSNSLATIALFFLSNK